MLPSRHIMASTALGAVIYAYTESLGAGIVCFLSGVVIDSDHIMDYVADKGLGDFSLRRIYDTYRRMSLKGTREGVGKLYLLFHAVEIAITFWVIYALTKNVYLLGLAAGYSAHIIMDVSRNPLKPQAYFFLYRCKKFFLRSHLFK